MKFFLSITLIALVAANPPHNRSASGPYYLGQAGTNQNGQGHYGNAYKHPVFSPPPCGHSALKSSDISHYIVGGQPAARGQFPWQVALVWEGFFICGGSYVIGRDGAPKVITAGHCVGDKKFQKQYRFHVIFGMLKFIEAGQAYWAEVTNIINHNQFNKGKLALRNDIAVLEFASLDLDALQATGAAPICLASRPYTDGEPATISGWGTTSEGGFISYDLMYVDTPVVDFNYCNSQNTLYENLLDRSMMCAGRPGEDACQGDSGGPMVAVRDGVWELIGVVSWGFGCGRERAPGVYGDIYALRWWLLQTGGVW